jgi:Mn2+/Fe2+ NRAMP family transporter
LSRIKTLGPGLISGAADTDPTTVATLVVVGATTIYGLAWLTVLMLPAIAVVQILATRVGVLTGRDLQQAVVDGYGRLLGSLLLVSILAVNVVTIAADLAAGAAAISLLTGMNSAWLVPAFGATLVTLLLIGKYDEVERVLKWLMLILLAYGAAVLLAKPDWAAVARGTLVPSIHVNSDYVGGALAIVGTTLTSYMYIWQTVEQVEGPPTGGELKVREFDGVAGAALASMVFWSILVASGATLGSHHQHADTTQQAAEALRPVAGPLASALFSVGLLASAIVATPVIMSTGAYVTAAAYGWQRGLSRTPRQAPWFYAVIVIQTVLGAVLGMGGISPIRLLFLASVIAGIATPLGLILLMLVAANPHLVRGRQVGRSLRTAGWTVAVLVSVAALVYLAQQIHLLPG